MPNSPRPAAPKRATKRKGKRKPTWILVARGDDIQAIHFRPRMVLTVGVAFLTFSALYVGATAYLLMRDGDEQVRIADARLVQQARQAQQEQLLEGYEDRIAALRAEIDHISSRRALDHATVSEKVDRVLDMQQTLDERQRLLARLADAARRAGFDIPPPPPPARPAGGPQASATPIAKPVAVLASANGQTTAPSAATPAETAPSDAALDQVESEIAAMELEQQQLVGSLATRVASRTDRLATLLSKLGRRVPKARAENVGGPYVPARAGDDRLADFGADVEDLANQLSRYATARKIVAGLPLSAPIANAPITSGFGTRTDPFLGRPAMHTGIDFRAQRGAPARAVSAGTVVAAEWNGGYGNMVDIDLGNGIVTRYGHLSSIEVKVGDRVKAGSRIGKVGSTGRSTGPHLHYEIRISGEPIDPMRFLNAGREISALL